MNKLLFLMVAFLMGCASRPVATQNKAWPKWQHEAELDYLYLNSQLSIYSEDLARAEKDLKKANVLTKGQNKELGLILAKVFVEQNKYDEAQKQYQALGQVFDKDLTVLKDKAEFHYKKGDTELALSLYSKITDEFPEDSNSWIYKGLIYLEQGDFASAWDSFDFLKKKSKDAKHLGALYIGKLMQISGSEKKAAKEYKDCLKESPQEIECVLALASLEYSQGQVKKAKKRTWDFINENDFRSTQVLIQKLVDWNMSEKNFSQAVKNLEILERVDPSNLDVKRKISSIFIHEKDLGAASSRMELIAESENASALDLRNYISILILQEKKERALDFIKRIQKQRKLDSDIFITKIELEKSTKQKIKTDAQECSSLNENYHSCMYAVALSLIEREEHKEALTLTKKTLKHHDKEGAGETHFLYVQILNHFNKEKRAINEVDKIIKRDDQHALALNYKAYYMAKNNEENLAEAERYVLRALAQDPNNGHFLDTYGYILYKLGRFEQAVIVLKNAFETLPNEAEIIEHLADAYQAVKKMEAAEKFYRLAIKLYKGENQERIGGKIAQIRSQQKRSVSSTPEN